MPQTIPPPRSEPSPAASRNRRKRLKIPILGLALAMASSFLMGCATPKGNVRIDPAARQTMLAEIQAEQPGDYFIGRRYYKRDYKFWGYVREPGKPWTSSRLVVFNEQRKHTPDRVAWKLGYDHGYEYKLQGMFSGDTVYEPASNMFYPEFVLTGIELRSTNPGPIFKSLAAQDPARRVIEQPF